MGTAVSTLQLGTWNCRFSRVNLNRSVLQEKKSVSMLHAQACMPPPPVTPLILFQTLSYETSQARNSEPRGCFTQGRFLPASYISTCSLASPLLLHVRLPSRPLEQ